MWIQAHTQTTHTRKKLVQFLISTDTGKIPYAALYIHSILVVLQILS